MARLCARAFSALGFLVVGFLGARLLQVVEEPSSPAFEVPREYRFLYDRGLTDSDVVALRRRLSVHRIVLERTGCFGTCPAYRLELGRDGVARYDGRAFTDREGHFEGEVHLDSFARLAYGLERVGFYELRASYAADWTDDATTVLTVSLAGGREVRVSDYGRQAPPEFWLITQAVDQLGNGIEWVRTSQTEGLLP